MFSGQHAVRCGNAYKCGLGHASIIKMAKALDLPFVCVFEDDAYPVSGISSKLETYLGDIPADTDVLMLGWSYFKTCPTKISGKLSSPPSDTHGSHAYIVF